jgi:hypothetical protein
VIVSYFAPRAKNKAGIIVKTNASGVQKAVCTFPNCSDPYETKSLLLVMSRLATK